MRRIVPEDFRDAFAVALKGAMPEADPVTFDGDHDLTAAGPNPVFAIR